MMDEHYCWWQETLAHAFLAPQAGPNIFFIDDDELRRIAPGLNDPARDLARAIHDASSRSPGNYFNRMAHERRLWKVGDRNAPPPVLPVLAMTVLAATRMHSDGHARSTNYYLRLAQSMRPDGSTSEVAALRTELSGSAFLDVVDMWRDLHEWIDDHDGRVGVSTIRTDARLTRIGYPQSQALLTRSDRAQLSRLFAALDIQVSGLPDERSMLRALDVWTTANQNRLGDAFMSALRTAETRGLIAAVCLAYAQAWDGQVLTKDGRRRIAVRLGLDLEDWRAAWLFPLPPEAPEAIRLEGVAAADHPVFLTANPPSQYGAVQNPPGVDSRLIIHGFRLRGDEYTAEFPKAEVLIFAADADSGTWSSTSGITPYETHLVAASGTAAPAVARVVSAAAESGWVLRNQGTKPLLPGFALYEGVRFTDDSALQKALSVEPDLRALGVAPTLVPRARFVRGLPLDRELAPHHYLIGGEPDLLLPTEQEPKLIVLSLGGKEELVNSNGFPFELRRFPSAEGATEVIADGQRLSFTLLTQSVVDAPPKGTGTLGWNDQGSINEGFESSRIVGAVVAETPDNLSVMCRRGREETWLLLSDGEVQRITEPGPPVFSHTVALSFASAYFEVSINKSARWLAQRADTNVWHLSRLGTPVPQEVKASFDVIGTWARTAEPSGQVFWDAQLGLANG